MLARAFTAISATVFGGLFWLLAKGKLTLDLNAGRSIHELGPIDFDIDAPRDLVYQQLSAPYLGRVPKDMQESLQILERGTDMVIARHVSKVMFYTSETVESVRFEAPERISFRHLRGPVPHAIEEFELEEVGDRTMVTYRGELGIDFWILGSLAGKYVVVPEWLAQVTGHMSQVKAGAEKRAAARRRREQRKAL